MPLAPGHFCGTVTQLIRPIGTGEQEYSELSSREVASISLMDGGYLFCEHSMTTSLTLVVPLAERRLSMANMRRPIVLSKGNP